MSEPAASWPAMDLFAEALSGFLWHTDSEGRLTAATSGFGRTAGLPIGEALGRPFADLVEGAADRRRLEQGFAAGTPFRDMALRFWPARRWTRIGAVPAADGHLGIARGQYPEQPGDIEALIAERVAQHKRGEGTFKRLRPGGDWALYRYFPLPVGGSATLITDITESERQQAELTRLATTDPLTGIANRRSFFDHAQREVERARRYGPPLGVFVLDLDFFKRVNDTYGHAVGDMVLQSVARHALAQIRVTDIVARTGGEEFGALLPETPAEDVSCAAERLRRGVAELDVPTPVGPIRVTASIGFSSLAPGEDRIEPALARADAALYRAKQNGRNRVEAG